MKPPVRALRVLPARSRTSPCGVDGLASGAAPRASIGPSPPRSPGMRVDASFVTASAAASSCRPPPPLDIHGLDGAVGPIPGPRRSTSRPYARRLARGHAPPAQGPRAAARPRAAPRRPAGEETAARARRARQARRVGRAGRASRPSRITAIGVPTGTFLPRLHEGRSMTPLVNTSTSTSRFSVSTSAITSSRATQVPHRAAPLHQRPGLHGRAEQGHQELSFIAPHRPLHGGGRCAGRCGSRLLGGGARGIGTSALHTRATGASS